MEGSLPAAHDVSRAVTPFLARGFDKMYLPLLDQIEEKISCDPYLPNSELVMRALSRDIRESKVLILGQDPYPNPNYPVGLAFSIPQKETEFPPSLKNIFKELKTDIGVDIPRKRRFITMGRTRGSST
jgi:uracil DNA glycosylase